MAKEPKLAQQFISEEMKKAGKSLLIRQIVFTSLMVVISSGLMIAALGYVILYTSWSDEKMLLLFLGMVVVVMQILLLLVLLPIVGPHSWELGVLRKKNAQFMETLQNTRSHDSLTGLYNRTALMPMLEKSFQLAQRQNAHFSLAVININSVQQVNLLQGQAMGDTYIKTAATILERYIRSSDIVARFSGDEFLIVLPDCPIANVTPILERAQGELIAQGEKREMQWGIHWGIATRLPSDTSFEESLFRANQVLLHVKQMKAVVV